MNNFYFLFGNLTKFIEIMYCLLINKDIEDQSRPILSSMTLLVLATTTSPWQLNCKNIESNLSFISIFNSLNLVTNMFLANDEYFKSHWHLKNYIFYFKCFKNIYTCILVCTCNFWSLSYMVFSQYTWSPHFNTFSQM